jgi:hypothetical protein
VGEKIWNNLEVNINIKEEVFKGRKREGGIWRDRRDRREEEENDRDGETKKRVNRDRKSDAKERKTHDSNFWEK